MKEHADGCENATACNCLDNFYGANCQLIREWSAPSTNQSQVYLIQAKNKKEETKFAVMVREIQGYPVLSNTK